MEGVSGKVIYLVGREEIMEKKQDPVVAVIWGRCGEEKLWCDFLSVNLAHEHFKELKGVYIIFTADKQVIRLGSGIIKDRIAAHRRDKEITAYENLKVTWAKVNALQMEGVEKFLADTLHPKIGDAFPDRTPIKVNLPW